MGVESGHGVGVPTLGAARLHHIYYITITEVLDSCAKLKSYNTIFVDIQVAP